MACPVTVYMSGRNRWMNFPTPFLGAFAAAECLSLSCTVSSETSRRYLDFSFSADVRNDSICCNSVYTSCQFSLLFGVDVSPRPSRRRLQGWYRLAAFSMEKPCSSRLAAHLFFKDRPAPTSTSLINQPFILERSHI